MSATINVERAAGAGLQACRCRIWRIGGGWAAAVTCADPAASPVEAARPSLATLRRVVGDEIERLGMEAPGGRTPQWVLNAARAAHEALVAAARCAAEPAGASGSAHGAMELATRPD